jgi:hypothetical protein
MPAHVVIDLDPVTGDAAAEWVALPERALADMPFDR